MAIPITCPSCKNEFTPSEASADGPFQCPHCNALVAAPGSSVRQTPAARPTPPKGARPQLLERLPPSPVTSPSFIAGGAAFVLAYGVVMSVVLSGPRERTVSAEENLIYEVAVMPQQASVPAPTSTIAVPTPKAATPKPGATDQAKVMAPDAPQPGATDPPKPGDTDSAKEKAPTEPSPQPLVANVEPSLPKPKPVAVPKPSRTIANLGKLIDAVGDCKVIPDVNGLTIALPGKLHVLSPELDTKNSPMALIDVEGNFIARVKVAGEVMPGRTPVDVPGKKPVEKMPFAFHGAGLLLWKDKDNYVRLERAGAGAVGHPHVHQILVEACKDGKPAGHYYADWPAGPTYLRMERTNDDLICSHSGDGQSWITDKALGALFPGKVSVGISASSISKKPFQARFEEFSLAEGTAETATPATP